MLHGRTQHKPLKGFEFAAPIFNNVCLCSVVSDSLRSHGLQPARLLCPWSFPGNNTIVVAFPTPNFQ